MNEQEIIGIVRGLYPQHIKDKRKCVKMVIDTKLTPTQVCQLSREFGVTKNGLIDAIAERVEGDTK